MLASITLDQGYSHYTNLDIISGKVLIRTPTSANVSSIVVKLEGESRTRLMSPANPNGDRPRPQLEFHKILYQVKIVFPPPNVVEERQNTIIAGKTTFTLPPGQHEYPFQFKFPFNNDCLAAQSSNPTVSLFGGLHVDVVKTPFAHVKRTLPPTLIGFPGEAEVRYYAKVTVNRPNIFKENARAYTPFNFCPIEPPRPPPTDAQVYARRRTAFVDTHQPGPLQPKPRKKWTQKLNPSASPAKIAAPAIAVDIRLPEPAILTCAKDVPLRIVLTSTNGIRDGLSLQSLQIELVSATVIRALDVMRTERRSTVIMSQSNIGAPIHFTEGSDETEIDSQIWRGHPIPNIVPPSFQTCNITQSYELIGRIGLRHDPAGLPPQYVMADLRLPVEVYSGITPPQELLDAMARTQGHPTLSPSNPNRTGVPPRKPLASGVAPGLGASSSASRPADYDNGDAPPVYSEAPPSYEDAIGQDFAPVHGVQRGYAPPAAAEDPLLSRDEKS